jgi:hypothetical protein
MFDLNRLEAFRSAQEGHMQDRADLLIRAVTGTDEYGMPTAGFVVNGWSACGLDTRASREMINAEAHIYDARLRLPHDSVITNVDRVRITQRFGVLLDAPIEYDVIGSPIVGPSGMLLNLRSLA